jgi:CHAD domain-containing protein
MEAIFESCFDQWLANQAAALDGRDPEGVHQMRVGLRRLRSALSIFKKLIPKSQLVEILHFGKDFAMAGGFLFLFASGAGSLSFDAWRGRR